MYRKGIVLVSLLAFLVGCPSGEDNGEPDVGVEEDVLDDVSEDADPGEDVGEDVGEDAGEDPDAGEEVEDLMIQIRYTDSHDGSWRVGAFLFHIEEAGGDEFPVLIGESASVPLDDEIVNLTIPAPGPEDFGPLFDGMEGAAWVLAAYADEDGDGVRGDDEPVEAIRGGVILFPSEDIPEDEVVANTWVGLDVSIDDEVTLIDLEAPIDLTALATRMEVTIGGTISAELLAGVTHLGSVSLSETGAEIGPNPPILEPLTTEAWEVTIDEPLDDERLLEHEAATPLPFSVERPVAFEDTEGTGQLVNPAQFRAHTCDSDGEEIMVLLYLPEVLDPTQALFVHLFGMARGWNPALIGDDLVPLDEAEWGSLTMDPEFGCSPSEE